MIIQTGLRTDIPAFYSKWLLNRLREGYVLVRNPYRPQSVTRYSLSPEAVDLIGFCTKNPAPMLPALAEMKRRCRESVPGAAGQIGQPGLPLSVCRMMTEASYWYVTITPYGREIEPNVPPKEKVMEDFKHLSGLVGTDAIGWRYDPILITKEYPLERHLEDFRQMAAELSGYTKTCVISFIDLYQKVRRNFPEVREVSGKERAVIGEHFAKIGRDNGMTVKACAEGNDLAVYGVDCGGCMTVETYEAVLHEHLEVPKQKSARDGQCACLLSHDIGAYDSCGHLCRYCYANANTGLVKENMRLHDPDSPLLIGHLQPEDQIHEARQTSWISGQMRFEWETSD